MLKEEIATIMTLLRVPGAGNKAARRAMALARSANLSLHALTELSAREIVERFPGTGEDHIVLLLSQCVPLSRETELRLLARVEQSGAQVLTCADSDFPQALARDLGNRAPALLFLAGDRELLDEPAVAIVGAREVSERGAMLAAECARTFARAGLCIVSGGAAGVDTAAQGAALDEGGKTVVVLPQGLLTFRGPRQLLQAIADGRAAILSEFLPDMTWQTHAAVTRNGTISALSRLVCVIEPKKQGGSVRTARCAIEQGKRALIYCAPGYQAVGRALRQAGAGSLLDAEGQFDSGYLLAQWESAPAPPEGQGELF